jgi:hypothetical protein
MELSYWDGVAVVHMARALDRSMTRTALGSDKLDKERENMINRIEGTPIQTIRTAPANMVEPEDIDATNDAVAAAMYQKIMKE